MTLNSQFDIYIFPKIQFMLFYWNPKVIMKTDLTKLRKSSYSKVEEGSPDFRHTLYLSEQKNDVFTSNKNNTPGCTSTAHKLLVNLN